MASIRSAADGRVRADEFLLLLARDDRSAAERLLEDLDGVRELAFLGAGLTAIARSEARALPPAQRAQASTRQVHLGRLRDARRTDVEGLRDWLRRAGEEILLIRAQRARAESLTG